MTREIKGADWLLQLENATLTTEPASDAQAIAKAATDVAVTPANLAAIGSSATFAGLVELATSAEAITGTDTARAVTPKALADKLAASIKYGTHAVTAGEATAGTLDIATGLAAATAFIVQIWRSGAMVLSDAAVSLASGTLTVADGDTAGYAVTEADVISWIVF